MRYARQARNQREGWPLTRRKRFAATRLRRSIGRAGAPGIAAAAALVLVSAIFVSSAASSEPTSQPFVASPSAKPKPAPKSKPGPLLKGAGIVRWGSTFPHASRPDRYSYILVSHEFARAAAQLAGKSVVYMSGTSVQQEWSTGVSFQEAVSNDWLLKDVNGAYVMNVLYDALVGDVGNRAYQRRFVANVAAFLKKTKSDGVFIDDVIATPDVLTHGAYPSKYPTRAAWEEAMVSFMAFVGPALKGRGYYVLANATQFVPGDPRSDTGEHTAAFWRRIAPSTSGLMNEYWVQDPNDPARLRALGNSWWENWSGWQTLVSVAQRAGVDFFGLTYGAASDARAMRYGRASFLLDWNGKGGAFIYQTTDRGDPYHPAWVTQFGLPSQPKFERAPGVWQRKYIKGIVVVNATTAPVTVRVNGAEHTVGPTDALFTRTPRR
jgi:hypothetical protein